MDMRASETANTGAVVNRLPAESLLDIFKFEPDSFLGFSHVCRQWRELIHGCSLFWATIKICLSNLELDQQAAYWLERAGNRSLSIIIQSKHFRNDPEDDDQLVPLARILRGHMARCEELEIVALPQQIRRFVEACAGDTPLLRQMIVNVPYEYRNEDPLDLYLPLVIPFTLPSDHASPPCTIVRFQAWFPMFLSFGAAITELDIEGSVTIGRTDDLLHMLRSCPNLVKFDLYGEMKRIGESSHDALVVLPHLTNLRTPYIPDVENLLDYLDLPSLQCLDVYEFEWAEVMVDTFWDLFYDCPSLSDISLAYSIRCAETDPPDLVEDTLSLPLVTHFKFRGNVVANTLLRRLALPNVQELDLRDVPSDIVHELISFSTQLRRASFRGSMEIIEELPTIILPTLVSLEIARGFEYIDRLHLPQLSSLKLSGTYGLPHDPPELFLGTSLSALMGRSAPPLVTLRLEHLDVSDQSLIWCLERLPLLEELYLLNTATTDAVLHAVAYRDGNPIVPRLTRFKFYSIPITPAGVISFLSSRLGNGETPLESAATAAGGARPRLKGSVTFDDFGSVSQDDRATIRSMGNFLSMF
ncbi:hypothetical protein BOTBODRAFT_141576 [Botryobasidium botryosum FD-172 SS1]|uniref:F-box domain-containing protein n=1 Tax=Botryobasidium botryosum (strain FD-172 SS1) TaxID=930990 RepID=A0A067N0C8_BOTB1|nr:hypothetical protein BOTBODRAFT_141576 [Botryobasidium botryosum FD-172 SS1]